MNEQNKSVDMVFWALQERAKELNCLYTIEEVLNKPDTSLEEIFYNIIKALPAGWQYPNYCHAMIIYEGKTYKEENTSSTPWEQTAQINVQDVKVGSIIVYYTEAMPLSDEGPFLKEERKLISTIAERIGHYIRHQRLKIVFQNFKSRNLKPNELQKPDWEIILELLKKTDQHLYSIISKKMVNHLFVKGIQESKDLFAKLVSSGETDEQIQTDINKPSKKIDLENSFNHGDEIFSIASKYIKSDDIINFVQKWMNEEKSHFLVKALMHQNTPISEVTDAIRKYHYMNPEIEEAFAPITMGIRVSLIRRFLTDQLEFINIAKHYCKVSNFYEILQTTIFPLESHGKLGGKSSGLILAKNILENNIEYSELLSSVKVPKTWYICSDGLLNFIYYNNLEEVVEEKYKDIEEIRQEYPHIIQTFKNSSFTSEIINGLSRALDDFGKNPIIVRSSSLLEDRIGAVFAGKYKSLFLANQGNKKERLDALIDAIAEVYASTFGPEPIGYRNERGLLDFNEEMAIMIQEVVGKTVGKYFFPAFAGVAFSNNEFRWSPRVQRGDGLIRLVSGLGTRAVDRISDDYPTLIAPGQPDIKVNLTYEDIIKYSPKMIDVINLENNAFESIPINKLVKEVGNNFPLLNQIFSIHEENQIKKPIGLGIDTKKNNVIVTFDNLISNTIYLQLINKMLDVLQNKLGTPVDIEFACDGNNLYLLQCRPQSSSKDSVSAIIPKDIPIEQILFTANKHVSNGRVPDINYIVYINSNQYNKLSDLNELKNVGRAVGKLNKILPQKKFILMGPGRWGTREDFKLGINVSYSDINNTAMLIEIARKKGNYIPDLSFGTHFFQDLVEASIRYLPLYPDDGNIIFNEKFLKGSTNILGELVPEYIHLTDTIIVINVPDVTNGKVLRVLMNAEEEDAIAFFVNPSINTIYNTSNKN